MKLVYSLIFCSLAAIGLIACGGYSPAPAKTKQEMLAKTWRTGRVLRDGTEDINTNYANYRWQFKADSTYVFTFAGGQTQNGRWTLVENNSTTTLLLNQGTAREEQATVQELTETNFNWEQSNTNSKNVTYRLGLQLVPAQ